MILANLFQQFSPGPKKMAPTISFWIWSSVSTLCATISRWIHYTVQLCLWLKRCILFCSNKVWRKEVPSLWALRTDKLFELYTVCIAHENWLKGEICFNFGYLPNPICKGASEWKHPVTIPKKVLYGFRFVITKNVLMTILNAHFHKQ